MNNIEPMTHFEVAGDPANPAMVLGHPLGMNLHAWDDVAQAMAKDFYVLRWDLPGHGKSQPVAESAAHLSELDLVNQLLKVCDDLNINTFHYAGTSIGGTIGQQLAIHHPSRLLSLTLTNTGAKIGSAEGWAERKDNVANIGLEKMSEDIVARWFSPKSTERDPSLKVKWQQSLAATDDRSYGLLCEWLGERDQTTLLHSIDIPLTFIAGKDDVATPPELVRELAKLMGENDIIELENVGHVPSVEASEQTKTVLGKLI
ncbi:alpha/beta fold hydrolase [Aliiglaciecola sp. 3_MG-2023]|uniref:alpha/beta fold hydrolase n=1 Tax=Aliiglaciecola sp. 3_MG-2023 TaxID=3062644 RepID=UPI0026E2A945|nr:alpha/beta fold hydrolase [Aliiglaciecola sp. 3_MG-2023]MDO6693156.1 alpha/beta fold hydrolase [Aliiglaciecola sp. 3_MG-2023]